MAEEFKCGKCGRVFDTERGLSVHQSQSHGEEDKNRKMLDFSIDPRNALLAVFLIGIAVGFTGGTVFEEITGDRALQKEEENQDPGLPKLEGIDLENEPSLGDEKAGIKVVEYSDYGCPWCAEWAGFNAIDQRDIDRKKNFDKLEENYIETGKVEFIYKDFPAHPNSRKAHKAANCVLKQSRQKYWGFHDQLFERRDNWMKSGQDRPRKTFETIATELGLKTEKFSQCLNRSGSSEAMEDLQNIRNSFRVGTPTFFIGNREEGFTKISGAQPYARLKQVIESKL